MIHIAMMIQVKNFPTYLKRYIEANFKDQINERKRISV